MWLCVTATMETKSSRAGSITRRVIRTWGRSVVAYFAVSESDRYGSISAKVVPSLRRKPLCPSHQRKRLDWPRTLVTSARKASSLSSGSIMVVQSKPKKSNTWIVEGGWSSTIHVSGSSKLPAYDCHSRHEIRQLLFRRPARGLRQAAVGGEAQALRRRESEAPPHPLGDVGGRFDVVALHVDHADGDASAPSLIGRKRYGKSAASAGGVRSAGLSSKPAPKGASITLDVETRPLSMVTAAKLPGW